MPQGLIAILLAYSLILFAPPLARAKEQLTIGNATVIVKTVTGLYDKDLRRLELRDDVYHNELIKTEERSATQLIFLDETTLTLGPNSQIVLDRFVYDPDPSKSAFVMTAAKGVFRFASGKLPKKAYKINTPAATIGIRGTVLDVSILPLEGADAAGKVAVEVHLSSGEADLTTCDGRQLHIDDSDAPLRLVHDTATRCPLP
jgi:hypothetical protein